MPVDIVPIEEGHIEGFHRTLDFVARERRYLAFLEAPPLESTRAFVLGNINAAVPICRDIGGRSGRLVRRRAKDGRSMPDGVLGMSLLPPFRGRESALT